MENVVFTIGHSTHPQARFIDLLSGHGITAVCDVRSKPYSRMNPQFNREELKPALRKAGIHYVFLGRELGARSEDPSCYENGRVQYPRVAQTALFQLGLDRVQSGMQTYRVALMCAEKEPLECHRTILVSRQLEALGIPVIHIHADGRLENHAEAVIRLRDLLKLPECDLFRSADDMRLEAYRRQEERIAYEPDDAEAALPKTVAQ